MARGDVSEVTAGDCTDLYCYDTGMYDTPEYGSVYVVDGERPALVDTGIGTNYGHLRAALDDLGVEPAVIVPTHVHLDHAGGTGFLAADFPDAEVVCHEVGAPHLADPGRLWEGTKRAVGEQIRYYVEPKPVPEDRIREVADGDVVDLGDRELRVHHAPGHAPHHCVFELPGDDAVFTADAAGIWSPVLQSVEPTTPPPNFDYEQCLDDVDLVESLDPEVLLYGHFGPVEGTDTLETYREVLTDWVEDIETEREARGDDDAVVEAFVDRALDREPLVDAWGERKVAAETEMNVRGVLRYLAGQ
jgi:glyoxylase-like metal-dependent hydrolase (beta-lactamase superfamily II)